MQISYDADGANTHHVNKLQNDTADGICFELAVNLSYLVPYVSLTTGALFAPTANTCRCECVVDDSVKGPADCFSNRVYL